MTVDAQLVAEGLRPVPATDAELSAMDELEAGDYEVYSEMLTIIAQEGKEIMTKIGISAMLHSGDSVAAIYTPKGDLVTAVLGTYLHCVTGQIPVKFILKYWRSNPTVGVCPGDVFYCNEAIYGGIHNPDQFAIVPVFYGGELIAWSVVGAHQAETGGSEPGGEITTARSRHDEGMKLTPIKIGERYQLREDLLKMMENFISRAPRMQVTDVKARVSAADRIRMRLEELAARRGSRFLSGLFRRMIVETAEGARARIREWNDGVYRHIVFLDTTGADFGLIRVPLALRKRGERITIDLSGTSPEHEGSFQALAASTRAHCAVNLYSFPFHDFPISAGMLEPIEFVIPHGTILDPDPEAAISCSPLAASAVFPLLAVCFSKMMFDSAQRELVCGFAASNSSAPMISARNQHGARITDFMGYPLNAWGLSARSDEDGVDVFGFPHCPWGKQPDVEDVENEFPVLHLYERMLPNTCGYGKYRGGLGAAIGFVTHHVPYTVWTSTIKESKIPTHSGLFGGYSQTVVPGIRVVGTDVVEKMRSGAPDIPRDDLELLKDNTLGGTLIVEHQTRSALVMHRGELLCASTQGGGGYGDVLERDPEAVVDDVRKGVITAWVAEHVYRVSYEPDTFTVDREETARWHEQERATRRARGKPWKEFCEEWAQLRPAEEALKYYGTWPNAEPNREVIRI
ncbi:MAG: hydantoinase B/oxoprolinase family protein [Acidimicrobiales bacterium]